MENFGGPQAVAGAIAIDHHGHVYAADSEHDRVLAWNSISAHNNAILADFVIGQPDFFPRVRVNGQSVDVCHRLACR
jgi:hypothetical protein